MKSLARALAIIECALGVVFIVGGAWLAVL